MTKVAKHPKIKATAFTCHAPEAQTVFVAGTFNEWNSEATPMAKSADGNWIVAVELPPGRHEFKFVVDGNWCCEPGCDETNRDCPKCVPNPFGTMNRVVDIA